MCAIINAITGLCLMKDERYAEGDFPLYVLQQAERPLRFVFFLKKQSLFIGKARGPAAAGGDADLCTPFLCIKSVRIAENAKIKMRG